jgi:hypothetical protein
MRRWLLVTLSAVLLLILAACAPAAQRKSGDLSATVKLADTTLTISNGDKFDWQNVKLRLNPEDPKGGYAATLESLRAGQSRTLPLMFFADSAGYRFSSEKMKAQGFSITCSTPNGKGAWTGAWP